MSRKMTQAARRAKENKNETGNNKEGQILPKKKDRDKTNEREEKTQQDSQE